jgi:hypothetical protein
MAVINQVVNQLVGIPAVINDNRRAGDSFQGSRNRHHRHARRDQGRQVSAIAFRRVDDNPSGNMIGAKRGETVILELPVDDNDRNANLAGDCVNTAENPAVVVPTYYSGEDANR